MTYCQYARSLPADNLHRIHHDSEHGSPAVDDDDLFRRLMLEIMQAGLSFETVLKRKETIYAAFPGIDRAAAFEQRDIARLLEDAGIIRHRLKIEAAIHNAGLMAELQKAHCSFMAWLDLQMREGQRTKEAWVRLLKAEGFRFVGPEIVNEWLMSANYLPGAHVQGCRRYRKKLHG